METLMIRAVVAWLAAATLTASAAEVGGVKLDDRVNVQGTDLVLNGAGLRKRFVFDVYVAGLYLTQKRTDPAAAVALPGNKRVAIRMLRDVGADTFSSALTDGVRANHSDAEFGKLEPRLRELSATMATLKEAKKGMAFSLDFAGSQTQLVVEGKPVGRPIAGDDFYRALLRIWLGDKPVQEDLKKALLGQPN